MKQLKLLFTVLFLAVLGLGNVWGAEVTGTITFGTNNVKIDKASVTGNDDLGNSWTITTAGTTSFTANSAYYQVGASKSPATSITFTTTLPASQTIKSMSAKFGGFSGTAGTVTLKVGENSIGTGSLNATTDVTVTSTDATKSGTVLTVTVTGIAKGVKVYNISYTYDDGTTSSDPVLESIAVKTAPTTLTYVEGQKFNPAGLVITKNMSAGDPEDVEYAGNESAFTFVPALTAALATTDTKVTITYGGKSVDQAITVGAFAPTAGTYDIVPNNAFWGNTQNGSVSVSKNTTFGPKAEKGISVSMKSGNSTNSYINGTSTRVYIGYTVTIAAPSGFELTAIDFTGSTWVAPTASVGTMDGKSWTGNASEVTFTFSGTSYMTNIRVTYAVPATLQSITVSGEPTKKEYIEGENFDPAGLTVTGNYSDESHRPITEGITWSEPTALVAGQTSVSITATAQGMTSAAYEVTGLTVSAAKNLDHIALNTESVKKDFWKGETFNYTGLVVTAYYDDETNATVEPLSVSTPDMTLFNEAQTITVSYKEGGVTKEATYEITVKTIANTQETAYTTAEAIALIVAGKDLSTEVYVKGKVSQVDSYNSTYKSITYWLDDNAFEVYGGLAGTLFGGNFSAKEDLAVNDEVVVKGTITDYKKNGVHQAYEFNANNILVSLNRPVVLQSIELNTDNVKKTYKIGVDDEFSTENLVVTAHYNVSSNDKTIDLSDVAISGYNMEVANNYTVTVSYTENEVTKTATYQIQVKPNCETLATITMGAEANGTFDLSIKGEQCAETAISTVLTAEPAEHYHLASVTATNGTVGAIEGNTCTISDITADAEITAVFEEDAKGTATFVAGATEATGTAPASITKYVGETLTVPANPFALAGHTFTGWKVAETTYQKGDEFTMVEGGAEFVAQWEALPVWATTYTSNVTLAVNGQSNVYAENVKVDDVERTALRISTGSNNGTAKITIPAGATALHFHAIAWKGDKTALTVKNGEVTLMNAQALTAYDGLSGNTKPYVLVGDLSQEYYCINFTPALTEETTFDFSSVKRCAIFGVNYVAPASVTLDAASHDFENVKEGETADFEFTATKNIFATGDIAVSFEGDDADAFSAGTVDAETGKFTVTFAPNEVRAYSATVKVSVDGVEATAALAGAGISATTPAISTDVETIEFGSVKQDATVEGKTVNVTLEYLDAANVAITGTVFTLDKTALTENGAIVISANTATMGTYSETLTISGEGADSKTVTVTMTVISKYASEYTSNVPVGSNIVIIDGVEYEAIKKGTGSASQSTTITVPKGTQTLHFHAVAWNNENTVLVVKQGATTLGSFNLYKDAGVKNNSPFTLAGDNYSTDQYFNVSVAAYTTEGEAEITFTTTASPYRFVLYGVNQEGATPEVVRPGLTPGKMGTICVNQLTVVPAGAKFYTLDKYDPEAQILTVNLHEGYLEAGVPYIFEAEAAAIDGVMMGEAATTGKKNNGLYAVLSDFTVGTDNSGIYGIVGEEVRPAAAGAIFKAGRCYIKLDEVSTTGSNAPARAFRVIGGTNVTTGFELVELTDEVQKVMVEGQLYIVRGGKLYNVNGVLVK